MSPRKPLRILELYSGIGGMRMAARESGVPFEIVGTYEINTTAVEIYQHNFPSNNRKKNKPKNIMGLTADHLAALHPDLIMMSPPCQPFTRQGLKRDVEDARTSSLLHFLDILGKVPQPPRMILLENVAGFETSVAREKLIEVLTQRNYIWQELLLSPTQFGVPNSRLRYYILAKHKPATLPFTISQKLSEEFPLCLCVKEPQKESHSDVRRCSSCCKPSMPSVHHLMHKKHAKHFHTPVNTNTDKTQELNRNADKPQTKDLNTPASSHATSSNSLSFLGNLESNINHDKTHKLNKNMDETHTTHLHTPVSSYTASSTLSNDLQKRANMELHVEGYKDSNNDQTRTFSNHQTTSSNTEMHFEGNKRVKRDNQTLSNPHTSYSNTEMHFECNKEVNKVNQTLLNPHITYSQLPSSLSHYLDTNIDLDKYLLSDKVLKKYHMILDIVNSDSQRSCCFTKGYFHYVEGTGSIIQHNPDVNMSEIYAEVMKEENDNGKWVEVEGKEVEVEDMEKVDDERKAENEEKLVEEENKKEVEEDNKKEVEEEDLKRENKEGKEEEDNKKEVEEEDLKREHKEGKKEDNVEGKKEENKQEKDEKVKGKLNFANKETSKLDTEFEKGEKEERKLNLLRCLQLRYFTPSEVAGLMCFPDWFKFPDSTTDKQRYRVLGNSINVLVVTCLLLVLVEGE